MHIVVDGSGTFVVGRPVGSFVVWGVAAFLRPLHLCSLLFLPHFVANRVPKAALRRAQTLSSKSSQKEDGARAKLRELVMKGLADAFASHTASDDRAIFLAQV